MTFDQKQAQIFKPTDLFNKRSLQTPSNFDESIAGGKSALDKKESEEAKNIYDDDKYIAINDFKKTLVTETSDEKFSIQDLEKLVTQS